MTHLNGAERPASTSERVLRLLDRLASAIPLLAAFLAFASLYAWQASQHVTPWLFTDELEFTQLARSIAETGEAARRGVPHSWLTLYPYLTAPAWWIDDVSTAYETLKTIGVLAMTLALFPAYALARMLVSRPAAFAVAVATVSIPAFAYSSFLVQEPIAYPYATLCLWLVVRALTLRTRRPAVAAVVAAVIAPFVRDELALIPLILVAAGGYLAARGTRAQAHTATWTREDWLGAWILGIGALIFLAEVYAHRSQEWETAIHLYPGRAVEYGLWAWGAFAIGVGVLPVVAGLALVPRAADAVRTRAGDAFAAVFVASLVAFSLYTAAKAAYISTVFATRVVERNLIYLSPLLFVAAAIVLEGRRIRLWALGLAAAFTGYVLATTPYQMDTHFYSDSPGLAILARANRDFGWTPEHAETVLLWMLVAATAVVAAVGFHRTHRSVATGVAAVAAVLTMGWTLAGELSAATASNSFARDRMKNFPQPPSWLDEATEGKPALYLGQQIADPTGVWMLEFWNRSVKQVWSLDGSGPPPGPTLTPDLTSRFGTLAADPGYEYVVADRGIRLVGDIVDRRADWILYRIAPPLRLEESVAGVFSDGWAGTNREVETVTAAYSRFATPGMTAGTITVNLSRTAWCPDDPKKDIPGRFTIRVGTLSLGAEKHGGIERVTTTRSGVVARCDALTYELPTPRPPFHVEVAITPPFVPREIDPNETEGRHLGAQVGFEWRPA